MTSEPEELQQETPQNKSGIELELEASSRENDDNGRAHVQEQVESD